MGARRQTGISACPPRRHLGQCDAAPGAEAKRRERRGCPAGSHSLVGRIPVGRRSAKRRRRSFANTLRAKSGGKKGGSIGRIKHNQSALRQSIAAWIGAPTSRGAAGVQVANGHGRVAQRSLRRWSCGDVSRYLEERFA